MWQGSNESNIGQIVVTAGHVKVDWASRHEAPRELPAGVRMILKDIRANLGFFYRDDMGVLAFNVAATDPWAR